MIKENEKEKIKNIIESEELTQDEKIELLFAFSELIEYLKKMCYIYIYKRGIIEFITNKTSNEYIDDNCLYLIFYCLRGICEKKQEINKNVISYINKCLYRTVWSELLSYKKQSIFERQQVVLYNTLTNDKGVCLSEFID